MEPKPVKSSSLRRLGAPRSNGIIETHEKRKREVASRSWAGTQADTIEPCCSRGDSPQIHRAAADAHSTPP